MVVPDSSLPPGSEAVQMYVELPKRSVLEFQREIQKMPDQVRKHLAKQLKKDLLGPAAHIVAAFPDKAPMSGMIPRWGVVKATVRTYPLADAGKAIATIGIYGENRAFNRLVAITERAGSRTDGLTPWGRRMTAVLQNRYPLVGQGGRFIWKAWLKYRPKAVGVALSAITSFVDDYNGKVR